MRRSSRRISTRGSENLLWRAVRAPHRVWITNESFISIRATICPSPRRQREGLWSNCEQPSMCRRRGERSSQVSSGTWRFCCACSCSVRMKYRLSETVTLSLGSQVGRAPDRESVSRLTVNAHGVACALGRAPPAAVQDPRVGEHAGAGGCADGDEAARGVLGLAVDQGHHIGLFGEEGVAAEVAVAPGCHGNRIGPRAQRGKQAHGDRRVHSRTT